MSQQKDQNPIGGEKPQAPAATLSTASARQPWGSDVERTSLSKLSTRARSLLDVSASETSDEEEDEESSSFEEDSSSEGDPSFEEDPSSEEEEEKPARSRLSKKVILDDESDVDHQQDDFNDGVFAPDVAHQEDDFNDGDSTPEPGHQEDNFNDGVFAPDVDHQEDEVSDADCTPEPEPDPCPLVDDDEVLSTPWPSRPQRACARARAPVPARSSPSSSNKRAREEPSPELLAELRERFSVALFGNKTVVVDPDWKNPETGLSEVKDISFRDFTLFYAQKFGSESAVREFLHHVSTRHYATVVFDPTGQLDSADCLNLWRGFAYPVVDMTKAACEDVIQPFLDHVFLVLCDKDEEKYRYVLCWLAHAVQIPSEHVGTCLVVTGLEGVGKSLAFVTFGSLFGRHFKQVNGSRHLTDRFNGFMRDLIFLFGDEAHITENSQLNMYITEPTIPIESKSINVETHKNRCHMVLASNVDDPIRLGRSARRFVFLKTNPCKMGDRPYFDHLSTLCKDRGFRIALLCYFLKHVDISAFKPQNLPLSGALKIWEGQKKSMGTVERWILHVIGESEGMIVPHLPRIPTQEGETQEIIKSSLHEEYINWVRGMRRGAGADHTTFCDILKKIFPHLGTCRPHGQARCFRFEWLGQLRKEFANYFNTPVATIWPPTAPPTPAPTPAPSSSSSSSSSSSFTPSDYDDGYDL